METGHDGDESEDQNALTRGLGHFLGALVYEAWVWRGHAGGVIVVMLVAVMLAMTVATAVLMVWRVK